MPELELQPPRESAMICWPVLWDEPNDGPAPSNELHVTGFYWPAYGEDDQPPPKKLLLDALDAWPGIYRGYSVVKVDKPDAFGMDKNYPVLVLTRGSYRSGLSHERKTMANALYKNGFKGYDQRWEFNPHCSVNLQTVLDPPEHLIVGPPELWYKDDEPVRV